MLSTLVSHNQDLRKLVEKGYAVSIDSSNLVVRDIPYLDSAGTLQWGAIVSKLEFIDGSRVKLIDHQIFFCGAHPCELNGLPIANLGGGPISLAMDSADLVVQRSFSNKPLDGFADLFEKIESYMNIICGPAMNMHNASPFTFRTSDDTSESVFKYHDTLTSRAEIADLSKKFKEEVVAVIGLGGTGSYVLDFLVKTPLKEIRGFDLDPFHVHNAFRSPGMLQKDELGKKKADVYQERYQGFRHRLNLQAKYIQVDSTEDLEGVTFAFVCVDKGKSRAGIIDLLIKLKIPFIDVGMGLQRDSGPICGIVRTTYFSSEEASKILERKIVPMTDPDDDIYRNNIQISELNALNACLAVIKYKQLKGFYNGSMGNYHYLLTLDNLSLLGDDGTN